MSSLISNSARRRNDFYTFFFHWATDRRSAVSAVVAGTVAGALVTSVFLVTFLIRMASHGWRVPNSAILLGAAVAAACATYATWKHFVIGPVVVLILSISLLWWVVILHDPAMAIILAAPLLGGPITAARGIAVLNSAPKDFQPVTPDRTHRDKE